MRCAVECLWAQLQGFEISIVAGFLSDNRTRRGLGAIQNSKFDVMSFAPGKFDRNYYASQRGIKEGTRNGGGREGGLETLEANSIIKMRTREEAKSYFPSPELREHVILRPLAMCEFPPLQYT